MNDNYFKRIQNPMTIIALFVGLTEIGFSIAFSQVAEPQQAAFLWFLIVFPSSCALGFFAVLFFRPQNFYSPGDFSSDEYYLAVNKQGRSLAALINQATDKQKPPLVNSVNINLSDFINSLSDSVIFYILKVANKPLSFEQHRDMLIKELPQNELLDASRPASAFANNDSLKHFAPVISEILTNTYVAGQILFLWGNLDGLLFNASSERNKSDPLLTLHMAPEVLKLIGERVVSPKE